MHHRIDFDGKLHPTPSAEFELRQSLLSGLTPMYDLTIIEMGSVGSVPHKREKWKTYDAQPSTQMGGKLLLLI
jgi:hypothetical protein